MISGVGFVRIEVPELRNLDLCLLLLLLKSQHLIDLREVVSRRRRILDLVQ